MAGRGGMQLTMAASETTAAASSLPWQPQVGKVTVRPSVSAAI